MSGTFYDASVRLNTGDRIHVGLYYTGDQNNATDFVQLDLF